MIRMIPSTSAGHAKAYFSEALTKTDYYLQDQELQGRFQGLLTARLGLTGPATKEAFFALCENKNPATGKALTPRKSAFRTIGYDINFHCPKSVSIIHSLAKDRHILDAFEKSVNETMQEIEAESETRVRKNGADENRKTGELIWSEFTHQTARPVGDNAPDPHLHSHCFVFNATWDKEEQKVKAGQFRDIKRMMPYYQARFQKRLSDKIVAAGYQVRKTKNSFEVVGVPQTVIDHFSKRTNEIGVAAKAKGITDAKELAELGARTRSKKQKGFSMDDLQREWRQQIKELNTRSDQSIPIRNLIKSEPDKVDHKKLHEQCISYALDHCFERASVVSQNKFLETAYNYALGNPNITLEGIATAFKMRDDIIHVDENGKMLCTTRTVLAEEKAMVSLAKEGNGKVIPLFSIPPLLPMHFSDGQKNAIAHIFTTSNRTSIVRGGAGTGKTELTKEVATLFNSAGKNVTIVAPTGQASRGVLRDEGFKDAETVAKLLENKQMQDDLKDQVLIVDESGLLGTREMTRLLDLTKRKNARLILLGDTRQHSSVVRGDALRILNKVAGIPVAEVSQIFRQKNFHYRSAVEELSKGNIRNGFDTLDKMNAIKTIDHIDPNKQLVEDYVSSVKKGKEALVVSPTHKQGENVTAEIRKKLRTEKLLGKKELSIEKYTNLNLTEAQKCDVRNYQPGQVLQFNQRLKGIERGSRWTIAEIDGQKITIKNEKNKSITLPNFKSGDFDVLEKGELHISKGDKIRITRNAFDSKKKRLNNGATLEVVSVSKLNGILLRNKTSKTNYRIYKNFGHLAHAHCITSHASQGKTVDEIFISQPAATFDATNAKQFYVSVSRGRHAAHIYTDDKEALLEHASELGDRQSALELVNKKATHIGHVLNKQKHDYSLTQKKKLHKHYLQNKTTIDRDYEPGL